MNYATILARCSDDLRPQMKAALKGNDYDSLSDAAAEMARLYSEGADQLRPEILAGRLKYMILSVATEMYYVGAQNGINGG